MRQLPNQFLPWQVLHSPEGQNQCCPLGPCLTPRAVKAGFLCPRGGLHTRGGEAGGFRLAPLPQRAYILLLETEDTDERGQSWRPALGRRREDDVSPAVSSSIVPTPVSWASTSF